MSEVTQMAKRIVQLHRFELGTLKWQLKLVFNPAPKLCTHTVAFMTPSVIREAAAGNVGGRKFTIPVAGGALFHPRAMICLVLLS